MIDKVTTNKISIN